MNYCRVCKRSLPDDRGGYVLHKGWWYCLEHSPIPVDPK